MVSSMSARASPAATGSRSGPAGRQRAIAEAERGIGDDKRQVLAKRRVLEPVVSRISASAPAASAARAPAARSRATQTGAEGRQQERFVADLLGGVAPLVHPERSFEPPAMPAGDDMGGDAARRKALYQRDHRWRLARAAGS